MCTKYCLHSFFDWDNNTPSPNHLLLDRSPNIEPLISCLEVDKIKKLLKKSSRAYKILTILYQKFSNLSISQRDMSGPRLGALFNNRRSGVPGMQVQATITSSLKIRNAKDQITCYKSTHVSLFTCMYIDKGYHNVWKARSQ
jgi:hypothetical protein